MKIDVNIHAMQTADLHRGSSECELHPWTEILAPEEQIIRGTEAHANEMYVFLVCSLVSTFRRAFLHIQVSFVLGTHSRIRDLPITINSVTQNSRK
jgi:hypothetical protein